MGTEDRHRGTRTVTTAEDSQASERRQRVKWLRAAGMTETEIAHFLKVSGETIQRDCTILNIRTPRAEIVEIIAAVLIVANKEVTGQLSTIEAQLKIEQLIEDAADAEIRKRLS